MKIIPIVYNHEFVFNSSLSGMLHPGNYRYYINTSNFSLFYDSAIFLPVLVLKPRGLMQFFLIHTGKRRISFKVQMPFSREIIVLLLRDLVLVTRYDVREKWVPAGIDVRSRDLLRAYKSKRRTTCCVFC